MTVLPNNTNTDANPPLVELRMLKSRAQNGERRRQLQREQREAVKKIERKDSQPIDTKPNEPEKDKFRRKKRNFFKWLFTPMVSTSRQVAPPPANVRVKIPIVYRNGEHKGVVVGGLRVPFSRPMQANRRSLMLSQDDVSNVIPEDSVVVLEFPHRLSSEEFDTKYNHKQQEKKRLKEEKLARELASKWS
ncbi:hypothetical protein PHMEG_00012831 [Phytophthora megakarya]|uniref:Uncharacterized protein n=1 Tax=Phytophthora megakarya TaxID=4795 RepID=A0A225W890_9STRA|nr:hypothetical protein PHMEG_00012831 [Phytophthora megakarya]